MHRGSVMGYQLHHFPIRFPSIFPGRGHHGGPLGQWHRAGNGCADGELWVPWKQNGWKLQDFQDFLRFLGAKNPGNLQDGAPRQTIAFSCLKNMFLNSMVGRYNEPVFMGFINQIITGGMYEYHETWWFHFQNSGECLNRSWTMVIYWDFNGDLMELLWTDDGYIMIYSGNMVGSTVWPTSECGRRWVLPAMWLFGGVFCQQKWRCNHQRKYAGFSSFTSESVTIRDRNDRANDL